ncbi:DoxX family protein [Paraburkholderia sp. J67]|uniref:DoxX family protein n=1 Tax=Paraburkholderia sp. J67 TaxID=2805435 RepID=UPI002ABE1819|nr:DoxX family protein [Paraburkholderia sp. J67]
MSSVRFPANDLRALAARQLFAAAFVASGIDKLFWPLATVESFRSLGLPAPMLGCVGSMLLELTCGVLLVVGYRTRAAANLLAGWCILSAALFHHGLADHHQLSEFLKNFGLAGGLLALSIGGAGAFSLDRMMVDDAFASTPARY